MTRPRSRRLTVAALLKGGLAEVARASVVNVAEEGTDIKNSVTCPDP